MHIARRWARLLINDVIRAAAITGMRSCLILTLFAASACGRVSQDSEAEGVIRDADSLPCIASIEPTGVVLKGDRAGVVPDPIGSVVRDTRGVFYSGTITGHEVAIWDETGQFIRTVGKKGRGPGELLGGVWLFMDPTDTLHVRDNAGGWTVFDTAGRYVRRMTSRHLGLWEHTTFLSDGHVLTTTSTSSGPEIGYFHVTNRIGEWVRTFGTPTPEDSLLFRSGQLARYVSHPRGETFWAVRGRDGQTGYVLQQWSSTGDLLKELVRDAPWFQGTQRSYVQFVPGTKPPGAIRVHEDESGLLFVQLIMPSRKWLLRILPADGIPMRLIDVRLDVIDPRGPTLLASNAIHGLPSIPLHFFRSSRQGYMYRTDEDDLPAVDIIKVELHPSPGEATGDSRPSSTDNPTPICRTTDESPLLSNPHESASGARHQAPR